MKRVSTLLVAVMFMVVMLGGEALAKGSSSSSSSSASSAASSAGRASSPSASSSSSKPSSSSPSARSSSSSSKPSSSSSAPRYNPVTNPKPQTYKGKTYTPPKSTAKFKNSPYYGQPGFGYRHHDTSNFFLWYFIFASGGSDDRDDYERDYAGHPNYNFGGFVISFVLLLLIGAGALFFLASRSRR